MAPRLGFRFNRDLDAVTFPAKLRKLTFGHEFDQDIRGAVFPEGLENLSFGWGFDQIMDGVKLPSGLKSLSFKHFFNQGLQLGHISGIEFHFSFELENSLRNLRKGKLEQECQPRINKPWSMNSEGFAQSSDTPPVEWYLQE